MVDDHRLFLSGVRAELTGRDGMILSGTAHDVDEAIEALRRDPPDVALVDVHMPGGGGLAVVENVRETNPDVKFLALSVSDAAEDVIAMIRGRSQGVRHQVHRTRRTGRRDTEGERGRCGLFPHAGRFRAGQVSRRMSPHRRIRNSTGSPPGRRRCCGSSPAAIRTSR